MDPQALGSWLIILTFVAAFVYLLHARRDFSPLGLASTFSTAFLLLFSGLLFTGAISFVAQQLQLQFDSPLILALLVPLGTLLGIWVRHRWLHQSRRG